MEVEEFKLREKDKYCVIGDFTEKLFFDLCIAFCEIVLCKIVIFTVKLAKMSVI